MLLDIVSTILGVVDKSIPDPKAKAAAQLEVLKLQQDGQFKDLEIAIDAIKAEAQSSDPWTSRARPSFLYVMYILLLSSIPFGISSIFFPTQMDLAVVGFQKWLAAIPENMWYLFGAGYLGYTGSRTFEKVKGVTK